MLHLPLKVAAFAGFHLWYFWSAISDEATVLSSAKGFSNRCFFVEKDGVGCQGTVPFNFSRRKLLHLVLDGQLSQVGSCRWIFRKVVEILQLTLDDIVDTDSVKCFKIQGRRGSNSCCKICGGKGDCCNGFGFWFDVKIGRMYRFFTFMEQTRAAWPKEFLA